MIETLLKGSLWLPGLILLTACAGSTDYFESQDIDHSLWSETDSVFFPIHIVENPDVVQPVKWNHAYDLTLTSRYSFDYPYQTLPVKVSFQQQDSLGWQEWRPAFKVTIPTVGNEGYLDGGGWGSLYKKEMLITGTKINFPGPGDYRIAVTPDTTLTGVISMTVELD